VASPTDAPRDVTRADMVASVRAGRSIGTNGPFVRVTIEGDDGQTAGLGLGKPTMVAATGGQATVHINIQSAVWVDFDTVELYVNSVPVPEADENFNGAKVPRYIAEPTLTLIAGTDFTIDTVEVNAQIPGADRHEATIDVPLEVSTDSWVVVLVKGSDGVSRPLWPMNPQDISLEDNSTLDDLVDGNVGEGGNPATAFTNPVFIDFDGNGEFDPPMTMPSPMP